MSKKDSIPLMGVIIKIKDSGLGTLTDENGGFECIVNSLDTLLFSYLGHEDLEYKVGASQNMVIFMNEIIPTLKEVVVTAVGIKKRRNLITHANSKVDIPQDFERSANPLELLSSRLAGVVAHSTSGSPGAAVRLRFRGSSSFFSNNSPLIVVDGVPMDNSSTSFSQDLAEGVDASNRLIDINSADIAEISVLKGPSASVLYGSRAANGAVLITTKSGNAGPIVIKLSSGWTFSEVNKLPKVQYEYAQGRPIDGVVQWRGPDQNERYSWGPKISDLEYDATKYPFDNKGRLVPKGTGSGVPARAYDNLNRFFRTGVKSDYQLSVSGGVSDVTYYFSASHLLDRGVIPNTFFQRSSFKASADFHVHKNLSGGGSLLYTNSKAFRVQKGSNTSGVTLGLLRTSPTFDIFNGLNSDEAYSNPLSFELPDGTQRAYRPGNYDSPLWSINKNPTTDNVNRFFGNGWFKYGLTDWLTFSYKLGIDHFNENRDIAFDILSNKPDGKHGEIITSAITYNHINSDGFFSFQFSLNPDIKVTSIVGHNYFAQSRSTNQVRGLSLRTPGFYDISNAGTVQATRKTTEKKIVGLYSDISLIYKEFLILNLAGRNDWTSTLPKGQNSYFYPSIGLAFILSELIKDENSPITYAKARGSWGLLGNDAPAYSNVNYYQPTEIGGDPFIRTYNFPALGVTGKELNPTAANAHLKSEKNLNVEVGLDLEWVKRIRLNLTLYLKRSTDQILPLNVSGATGYTSWLVNSGEIQNKGIEIDLNFDLIHTDEFSWRSGLSYYKNENKVIQLYPGIDSYVLGGTQSIQSRIIPGQPYGVLYGSKYVRNEMGQLVIGDSGYPLVDSNPGVVGDPNPEFLLNLSQDFQYQNLSLSFLFDIRYGGDVWNGTTAVLDNFGVSQKSAEEREIRGYIYEGVIQNPDGSYIENSIPVDFANPELGLESYKWQQYGLVGVSEDYVQDASWIRLRSINIGYKLTGKILSRLLIKSAIISLSAHNLFLLTNYPGMDPEINLLGDSNALGLDFFNNPNTRSFGISMSVQL